MFQKALLIDADLVELINVNQHEAPQIQFRIPFALEVQTVGIAEAEFRWKNDAAIG